VGRAARRYADPVLVNPRNYLANLQGVVSPPLSAADMAAIAGIDRNCRLIKGQVFFVEAGPDLGRSLGREWSDPSMTGAFLPGNSTVELREWPFRSLATAKCCFA
jgi:hypothetical protein